MMQSTFLGKVQYRRYKARFVVLLLIGLALQSMGVSGFKNGSLLEGFDENIDSWAVPPSHWVLGKNIFDPGYDSAGGMEGGGALRFDGNQSLLGRVFKNASVSDQAEMLSVWIKTCDFSPRWVVRVRVDYMDKNHSHPIGAHKLS